MQPEVLILGSGAAGLTLAIRLADAGRRVTVVSKSRLESGSTLWAQGGISAVMDDGDSVEAHVQDTLVAGGGLCDEAAVRFAVERGADAIGWLIDRGVAFTMDGDSPRGSRLHLTREGGHSHRRVVHAADATGRAMETTLAAQALAHSNIEVRERVVVLDLILDESRQRAVGAYLYDRESREIETYAAKVVALCTGGANQVYLYSSNPFGASGDGIAMAWRAGCRIANMEFMQFHPTCLYHKDSRNFLITEALRGEGGHLRLPTPDGSPGERFMLAIDDRAELAPRDIVARAIDHEMKRLGLQHVLLDVTHLGSEFLKEHFPGITGHCQEFGIDISAQAIPVVPSAHFTCGGVLTDFNARTDVNNLYAIGEVACTGLHGANRLASNSLLECSVFATAAARDIESRLDCIEMPGNLKPWDASRVVDSDEDVVVSHNWLELRNFMWDYVGIVRTTKRLKRALNRVELLKREIHEFYGNYRVSHHLIELRNLVVCAELIIRSALSRKESRGLHYTLDYPESLPDALPTIISGKDAQ